MTTFSIIRRTDGALFAGFTYMGMGKVKPQWVFPREGEAPGLLFLGQPPDDTVRALAELAAQPEGRFKVITLKEA